MGRRGSDKDRDDAGDKHKQEVTRRKQKSLEQKGARGRKQRQQRIKRGKRDKERGRQRGSGRRDERWREADGGKRHSGTSNGSLER